MSALPAPALPLRGSPFIRRPRVRPNRAALALGAAGAAWLAGLVGLLGCALAIVMAFTMQISDIVEQRAKATAIRGLVASEWQLARVIEMMDNGTLVWGKDERPAGQAWAHFTQSLEEVCRGLGPSSPYRAGLSPLCESRADLFQRLKPQIEAYSPPRQRLGPATRLELLGIHDDLVGVARRVNADSEALIEWMIRNSGYALLVIGFSIVAFGGAGLTAVLLIGRATSRYRAKWREATHAARQASETGDLLRETIEALPGGVVVYDADERLVMFNALAATVSPALQVPGAIGRTYEDMAHETARRLEAAGQGPQPVDEWVARFRRKDTQRTRQAVDGRWFDWSERLTPSGRTVGLRVDVTEMKKHEQALEHARAEYQSLVDSLTDVVFKADLKTGLFTFAGAAAADFLGVPVDRVVGTPFMDYVAIDDRAAVQAIARTKAENRSGTVDTARFRMKAAGGVLRHIEVRYRKIVDEQGRIAIAGVIRDVEEQWQLERRLEDHVRELDQARGRYQSLVDSLSDMVYAVDAKGFFTYASPAVADLLGAPSSALLGTPFRQWVIDEDVEKVLAAGRAFQRAPNEKMLQMQFRMKSAQGAVRTVELRYRKPVAEGQSVAQIGVIRDVSERVELERRLEEETTRLRSIVESSGALVALTDRDLKLVMVNGGFTAMTGIAAADAVGRPLDEVLACPLTIDRTTTEPARFAVKLDDALGSHRLITVTATPIADGEGRISNIVLLGVDDTERRQAEQALNDTERFATVGEMAGTMAHEISQPLQVINIACASAREELGDSLDQGSAPDGAYLKLKLDRIAQQVECASRIVGDLRAFVHGAADHQPQPFDPIPAIKSAVKLTAYGMRQAGIALSTSANDGLPLVTGDAGKLEQVIVNLLNNARDSGARTIDVVAQAVQRDGRPFVRIAVQDSGPGIEPSVLPQLFVAFVTTKPRGTGTGLGLRICRRIVEEMGGRIAAANLPEGGACFEVLLPVAES